MLMGIKEIQEIIPHRHPFLLVDCIEELEPGVKAVGSFPGEFQGKDCIFWRLK